MDLIESYTENKHYLIAATTTEFKSQEALILEHFL